MASTTDDNGSILITGRNEKDYSHEGVGKILKTMNGDHLTKVTSPPKWL
jgi:hypothetical protein